MLILVVALKAEARPLIRHFCMTAEERDGSFRTFRSDTARLVVSGVGAAAARRATEYATAGLDHPSPCLNVGVAGHGRLAVGTPLLIHKVTDRQTGDTHFPAFPFALPCATASLVTVTTAETAYVDPCAYDMEGSGFFAAAVAAAGNELAHSVKVVSDNPLEPVQGLSGQRIGLLLGERLELIESLVSVLTDCAGSVAGRHHDPPAYDLILQRWHFTFTQRHQLRRLLQRWHALAPGDLEPEILDPLRGSSLRSARQVITFLQSRIDSLPFPLP